MNPAELAALRKSLGMKTTKPKALTCAPGSIGATASVSESQHQMSLMRWAAMASATMPELKWLYAIPNGGYRNPATAGRMKGEGVKAGVFDLALDCARQGFHGLKIEMKTPRAQGIKGASKTVPAGKPSPEQLAWHEHYTTEGYSAHFCYGWWEARDVLIDYLAKASP